MTSGAMEVDRGLWLLCRVGSRLCALPFETVVETMRPLPIEPVAGMPPSVRGLSIIRGVPTPIIELGLLFAEPARRPRRLVTITSGGRPAGLLVDDVLGVRSIGTDGLAALPPLLRDAAGDIVSAIGALDDELLLVLQTARLVPESFGIESVAAESPPS